jgi:NAD(P)H dehydrogenase (quinone)
MTLAITGSTGAVGGSVARQLADLRPRLLVRDASRAPDLPGGEVAVAEYGDGAAAERALAGVDLLFMVSAAESKVRRDEHRSFIAAAARAGVRHIVYTSFAAAAPDATFTLGRDHHDAEQAVRESGMRFTFLRDNFYADFIPHFADENGVIRGPAGDGLFAPVARADVADVAALVLRSPADHANTAYELTGPEALTMAEAAARAGHCLGREMRYEEETLEEAYASRREAYGAPDWQLDAWVSTYTAIADGSCAHVSDDVRRITGHPARTLEQTLSALSA